MEFIGTYKKVGFGRLRLILFYVSSRLAVAGCGLLAVKQLPHLAVKTRGLLGPPKGPLMEP